VTTSPMVSITAAALADVLEVDPLVLRSDSPLDDLGADSMARVGFADAVEDRALQELGVRIEISDEALAEARSLGDLAEHVESLVGAARAREAQ